MFCDRQPEPKSSDLAAARRKRFSFMLADGVARLRAFRLFEAPARHDLM